MTKVLSISQPLIIQAGPLWASNQELALPAISVKVANGMPGRKTDYPASVKEFGPAERLAADATEGGFFP
jgi:hypothetical protein